MGFCGIDISKLTLDAAVWSEGRKTRFGQFANDAKGFEELTQWAGEVAKFAMEATGVYHKELLRCLQSKGLTVVCFNPYRIRQLAQGLGILSKDDKIDARVMAQAAAYVPQKATSARGLALELAQEMSRRIQQVKASLTKEKVRLKEPRISKLVKASIERSIASSEQEIELLESELDETIASDPKLAERHRLLLSVPNIGPKTARILVSELPEDIHDRKKAVGLAGLAPRHRRSGTSLNAPDRISRCCNQRLKHALYMPAVQALRRSPDLLEFCNRLVANGKHKLQAITAVMRKIFSRVIAVLARRTPWQMRPVT